MKDKLIDYRGDCWKGVKDVRRRLKIAKAGQTISFVCEKNQVSRILRVIVYNDGIITDEVSNPDGVFITVSKT